MFSLEVTAGNLSWFILCHILQPSQTEKYPYQLQVDGKMSWSEDCSYMEVWQRFMTVCPALWRNIFADQTEAAHFTLHTMLWWMVMERKGLQCFYLPNWKMVASSNKHGGRVGDISEGNCGVTSVNREQQAGEEKRKARKQKKRHGRGAWERRVKENQ